MTREQRIYFSDLISDFLASIIHNEACSTVLLVCSTRDHFLEQLSGCIHPLHAASPTSLEQQLENDERRSFAREPDHPFLRKTIGLLANSRKIKLAFCPTIEHLRAYLSGLRITDNKGSRTDNSSRPLLAIVDLVALHATSSEFSAQGLSRTLALAVEVSARESLDIVLCECKDALDPQSSERGDGLWNVHVPLLSGTTRSSGEGAGRSGSSVPVKSIAQRWFNFEQKKQMSAET
ncbi:hypothetical protein C8Q69DRAFT_155271 [Paecilomyces variotii]|uniref:Elongator complex protein 5 n=1 Tax=Byssochlamys spectabilis TaxID=264951 RepID=A0A443I1I8_BYSSP|nr:hypothetical protein C8Q69DRAFT_155271 [Paecilomyces variotii]RWQ97939.1 hypothetical protein C8Q69DRAFT_155271 [Paecilomyces variotii]